MGDTGPVEPENMHKAFRNVSNDHSGKAKQSRCL
jgi:hypothetical protein